MRAPNILPGNNDLEKLHALCELTYQHGGSLLQKC